MTAAISAAEVAQNNLAEVTERLAEAQMAFRRVSLRVDNGDLTVTAAELAEASEQVEFLKRLAAGAQKAADAAASGQVAEDTRAAVALVLRDYPQAEHVDAMRQHLAAAAAEIGTVVEAIRERNDAITKARAVVTRAVNALPAGSLPEFENGNDAFRDHGIAEGMVEEALAAAIFAAIGAQRSGEITKTITKWFVHHNAVGIIGDRARELADSRYRVAPKEGQH